MDRIYKILFSLTFFFLCHGVACAEDGSSLWLRYTSLDKTQVSSDTHSPTIAIARSELEHYGTLSSVKLVIDKGLPSEGFRILAKGDGAEIRASQDIGLLYGAYALLRQQQTSGVRLDSVCACSTIGTILMAAWRADMQARACGNGRKSTVRPGR